MLPNVVQLLPRLQRPLDQVRLRMSCQIIKVVANEGYFVDAIKRRLWEVESKPRVGLDLPHHHLQGHHIDFGGPYSRRRALSSSREEDDYSMLSGKP